MYETLVVDGTDLSTIVTCITSLDGLYNLATPRGENVVFPGVDGETHVDKPYGTGLVELGLTLAGSTTTQFNDAFRVLRKLIQPGKQLSLVRHISYTSGNEQHVAQGEWASGLAPTMQLMRFGRTTLGLKILTGLWYAPASTTVSVTSGGTATVGGEARTHRLTVTMPAGTTLTNTTTGHTMANSATGSSIVVDVEQMTATQGGNDVSGSLTFNQRFPMRLAPGVNSFTGPAVTITYTAAYL